MFQNRHQEIWEQTLLVLRKHTAQEEKGRCAYPRESPSNVALFTIQDTGPLLNTSKFQLCVGIQNKGFHCNIFTYTTVSCSFLLPQTISSLFSWCIHM